MAAAAHDPAFARKMGIDLKVAREYNAADLASGTRLSSAGGLVQSGGYMEKKKP